MGDLCGRSPLLSGSCSCRIMLCVRRFQVRFRLLNVFHIFTFPVPELTVVLVPASPSAVQYNIYHTFGKKL